MKIKCKDEEGLEYSINVKPLSFLKAWIGAYFLFLLFVGVLSGLIITALYWL